MKTTEEVLREHFDFDDRKYLNGMPHLDDLSLACREYAEPFRRLAKDAAFELGNANVQILKLKEQNTNLLARHADREKEVEFWKEAFNRERRSQKAATELK